MMTKMEEFYWKKLNPGKTKPKRKDEDAFFRVPLTDHNLEKVKYWYIERKAITWTTEEDTIKIKVVLSANVNTLRKQFETKGQYEKKQREQEK